MVVVREQICARPRSGDRAQPEPNAHIVVLESGDRDFETSLRERYASVEPGPEAQSAPTQNRTRSAGRCTESNMKPTTSQRYAGELMALAAVAFELHQDPLSDDYISLHGITARECSSLMLNLSLAIRLWVLCHQELGAGDDRGLAAALQMKSAMRLSLVDLKAVAIAPAGTRIEPEQGAARSSGCDSVPL